MAYIIMALFIMAGLYSLIEQHLQSKQRSLLMLLFFVALVLTAGLREVGIDADSENYEMVYRNYYYSTVSENTEFTYLLISAFYNIFTNDVHLLFLTYAIFGVGLKFIAIRKTTELAFLSIAIYICFYYCVHEVTQIRTGILSGLFLLSIIPIAEGKRKIAFLLIAIGSCFHVSGLILMPLLFLNNRELCGKRKILWSCIIPVGYVIYFIGHNVTLMSDIPYIGAKLAFYQQSEETGKYMGVNVFGPLYLLNVMIFFYLMFFSKTITEHNKYFPILIKIFALGIASYATFSFVTVIAERISLLIRVVGIILLPCIAYTIAPRWLGIVIVLLLGVIYLNYGLNYIDFHLLWKVG